MFIDFLYQRLTLGPMDQSALLGRVSILTGAVLVLYTLAKRQCSTSDEIVVSRMKNLHQ